MSQLIKENPILLHVKDYLKSHWQPFSEYELIQHLDRTKVFNKLDFLQNINAHLLLFYKHFLVMNALYSIQEDFWKCGNSILLISPLKIEQLDVKAQTESEGSGLAKVDIENPELKKYYLNFDNLFSQSSESVEELLSDFWRAFSKHSSHHYSGLENMSKDSAATEKYIKSCDVLGVKPNCKLIQIRNAYRAKVLENHPDRGGKAENFISVREAYEYIKAFYQ